MLRMIPCVSNSLVGIAYTPGESFFYVKFKRGDVYWYDCADEFDAAQVITDILFAESQGAALQKAVHGLPFVKVEDPTTLEFHA